LGVEPTGVANIANSRGIPTIQAFFCEEVAREIHEKHGEASLITAANVFAHVANLGPCIRGVYALLANEGTFVSESHYLLDLVQTLQYDTIYHEHLRFYSIKPMIDMMRRFGFGVVDVERIPNHGGSIRVYPVKGAKGQPTERLKELQRREEEFGLYDTTLFLKFRERVQRSKWKLMALLSELKQKGHRIAGIGSPGRSSTVMNYCGIGPDILDYIGEQPNSLKIGLYTPGTHVYVCDEQKLFEDQPDFALVLAWHLGESVPRKLRSKGLKSKFIMPLPDPLILDW
ncbi:MAG: methyltransferase domain-containing protein, partial [Terriglobia bacterium]